MPRSVATSLTVRPSAMTARTALYLCADTLISLMRGSVISRRTDSYQAGRLIAASRFRSSDPNSVSAAKYRRLPPALLYDLSHHRYPWRLVPHIQIHGPQAAHMRATGPTSTARSGVLGSDRLVEAKFKSQVHRRQTLGLAAGLIANGDVEFEASVAWRDSDREWNHDLEASLVDMELLIEALDSERLGRRILGRLYVDFGNGFDVDRYRDVSIGNGTAVDVPPRVQLEDNVESCLLPAHVGR